MNFWKLQANAGLDDSMTLDEFINEIDKLVFHGKPVAEAYHRQTKYLIGSDLDSLPALFEDNSYANAAVLSDGHLGFDNPSIEALFRESINNLDFIRSLFGSAS